MKIGIARFKAKAACERDLGHIECAAHKRSVDFYLPEVRHALGAVCLVLNRPRGTLVFWPQ
jgi:hypothetical protein